MKEKVSYVNLYSVENIPTYLPCWWDSGLIGSLPLLTWGVGDLMAMSGNYLSLQSISTVELNVKTNQLDYWFAEFNVKSTHWWFKEGQELTNWALITSACVDRVLLV